MLSRGLPAAELSQFVVFGPHGGDPKQPQYIQAAAGQGCFRPPPSHQAS